MSKELEALKHLRNNLQAYYTMENVPDIDNNLNIVEAGLKRLEEIVLKTIPNMKERYYACNEERIILRNERAKLYKETEKLKQILEIIKEEQVDLYRLGRYLTLDGYNEGVCIFRQLTQEEFDLLKEAFK